MNVHVSVRAEMLVMAEEEKERRQERERERKSNLPVVCAGMLWFGFSLDKKCFYSAHLI